MRYLLKKTEKTLLVIFFALQTMLIQAQSNTHTGDITVTTQAAVDALGTTLTNIDTIDGTLTIGNIFGNSQSDITNLTPLRNITHITGYLTIEKNGQLVNLTDLNNLQSVGGGFSVSSNANLATLGNFPNLQSIGGSFEVYSNFAELTTLGNFPALQNIGEHFSVFFNDKLLSLGSFPNLTSVGISAFSVYVPSLGEVRDNVSIVIEENLDLVLCSWLEEFLPNGTHAVTGDIYIQGNATGCETTEEINNSLPLLLVNNSLFVHKDTTTTSFNIYANVRWQLATSDNATWITSLSSGSSTHSSRITGENETTITLIHTRAPNETPRSTTLTLTAIDEEGNELVSPAAITINLTQLSGFYEGDVTLSSQEEVNEFISNTTLIDGNLTIGYTDFSSQSDITDLTPLSNITDITGNLNIQQNEQLVNFTDLTHLQSIGGSFNVLFNGSLITLRNFSNLQSIGGDFLVGINSNLSTLEDFSNLQSIEGVFIVSLNNQLTTLGNFPNLQSIGGYFSVCDNDTLTTLGNFPALTSIGVGSTTVPSLGEDRNNVSMVVENNSNLSDCSVLTDLLPGGAHAVSGDIYISNNATGCSSGDDILAIEKIAYTGDITVTTQAEVDSLRTTLANVDSVDGNLTIGFTSGSLLSDITDLAPLSSIVHIMGNIRIQQNGQLVNLNALTHLQSIGGYFSVYDNNELITLGDFPNLQSIGKGFSVTNNDTLTTLGNFPALTSVGVGSTTVPSLDDEVRNNVSMVVENNSNLSDCYALTDFLPDGVHAVSGDIYISNNATGCNSPSEININEINTSATHRGDITVTTQAEVDALGSTLTNIDTIDGNLTIGYTDGSLLSDISDLSPLRNIVHITGNLIIQQNDQLVNLNDLNNLQTIGGYLSVYDNDELITLGDFPLLQSIGEGFQIANNDRLTTPGYFPALRFIEGGFFVGNNDTLTTLGIFPVLQTIGVGFYVEFNSKLITLGDFPVLQTIEGFFSVYDNHELITLGDFPVLQTIGGYFNVRSNRELTDLGDFPVLQTIGGYFNVYSNDKLTDLGDFSVLQTIGGYFYVSSNSELTDLGDFPVLQSIGGYFDVSSNRELTDLGEFPVLQSIGEGFGVYYNRGLITLGDFPALTSIGAGNNIYVPSLDESPDNVSIVLENNFSLSDCYVLSDFLLGEAHAVSGGIYINNNAGICSNKNVLTNTIYRGDITVTTQAEVDILNTTLAGKTIINGNLIIGYIDFSSSQTHITNLTPLSNIVRITKNVWIQQNEQLVNLNDLNNLQTIGGFFSVHDNDSLTTLGDFPVLQSIGEGFEITDNDSLTTLGDFPVLQSIGEGFEITDNDSLTTLGNFPLLQSIGEGFEITNNDTLTTLGNFPLLQSIGEGFEITNNDRLTTLGNFPSLQSIGESFYVTNNDTLSTLGDFPALTSIGAGNNIYVPSLGEHTDNVSIVLEDNFSLSDCYVLIDFLPGWPYAVSGDIYINNNAGVCSNKNALTNTIYLGDITVTTQAEVDTLNTTLAGKTIIVGNLIIGYTDGSVTHSDIDDLTPLSNIVRIMGNVWIQQNEQLANLNALTHLQTIGGYFSVSNNDSLTTLGNFHLLQSIGEYFSVSNNNRLTTPGDFPGLQSIGEYFSVSNNNRLTTLGEFPGLQSIGEYFSVNSNTLTTLGNFPALQSIGEVFSIYDNDELITLGYFPVLQSIEGGFEITNNDRLTNLGEFPALTSIGAGNNIYVPSLGEHTDNVSIVVEDNSSLSDCYVLIDFIPGEAHAVSGDIYINNNAGVCSNKNALTNTIYHGDITVTTQAEVDILNTTLAGKIIINGHLIIGYIDFSSSQTHITNLTPLSNIVRIMGNVWIRQNEQLVNLNDLTHLQTIGGFFSVRDNDSLTTLGDFPVLQSIGGVFWISSNDQLTNLGEFPVLQSVEEGFWIYSNDQLTNLGEFPVLQSIGGSFDIINNDRLTTPGYFPSLQSIGAFFEVTNNDTLTTLGEFPALQSIGESFVIINNDRLTTPGYFPSLQSIGEGFEITNNDRLTNLGEFPVLQSIGKESFGKGFSVDDNDELTTLGEFPALQSIGAFFEVTNNDTLTTLGEFPALQSIGAFFKVTNNDTLTTLGEFPVLQSIGGYFSVYDNDTLTTLGDFPVLQSIGKYFSVINNGTLTTLGNFPALTSIGIGYTLVPSKGQTSGVSNVSIVVENNPRLSNCYVLSDFLSGGTHVVSGDIFINDNAISCNSEDNIKTRYRRNIIVTKQTEVNALINTLSGKTIIVGNLTIGYTDGSITRSDIDDLTPLSNIIEITGNVIVQQNRQLVNLNALNNLQTIGGYFNVTHNDTLVSLGKFSNLTSIGIGEAYVPSSGEFINNVSMVVENNPSLSDCYTLTEFLSGGTHAVSGDIFINNNAIGCNNQNDIKVSYYGDITINTQIEVDALSDTLSGKTIIVGNLTIGYTDFSSLQTHITNLTPLSNITHITENIVIQQNGQLVNLTGLDRLQIIGGHFSVSNNDQLPTLGDFSALQTIGGYFGVSDNDTLTTLGNFPNLTSIGMDDNVNIPSLGERKDTVSIVVENNPSLSDCCVLARFLSQENNRVEGNTFITNNSKECNRDTIQNTCHTLIVTTNKVHQIAYDYIDPIPISFTVGGAAMGWTNDIAYTYTNDISDTYTNVDSIILYPEENTNQKGYITIMATTMRNTGVERTATITLRTTGEMGTTPATQTIVIRQEGYPPYEGDVTLENQAQVDTVRAILDTVTAIAGNLTIGPSNDITNLDSLYFLTEVTGNIRIEKNFNLVNVGNFPFLQKIEGNFSILGNGDLEHVGSFPSLVDIGGYFSVNNNDNLHYLYNFPALTSIDSVEGVSIEIKDNDLLTYCCLLTNFMDGTHQVSGSIDISGNATGCNDISEVNCTSFIDLSEKRDTLLPFISSDFDFTVSSNRRWKLSPIADWVTLSVDSGGIDDILTYTSVTITPLTNTISERRTATIKLTTIGHGGTPDSVLMNIIQEAAPQIRLANSYTDRDTIDIAYDNNDARPILIEFTVGGSATGWEISITYIPENTNFINLDPLLRNDEKGDIRTMAIPSPNTNHEKRTAIITLSTRGHEGVPARDTLIIIQEAAPTIMLADYESGANVNIAHDDNPVPIPITFTVGGSATGWESEISYLPENTNFITLGTTMNDNQTGNITIMASPMKNTGVERTATITLRTTGQKGNPVSVSLTFTQKAVPTIELISSNDISIAHDDTDSISINFIVGGSATGWESEISYMGTTSKFVTLFPESSMEQTSAIAVKASAMENMDGERTAIITLRTTGQKGADSVSLTITQEAIPTIELISNDSHTIIHDATASIPIEFTVGGSATGWESDITDNPFISLSLNKGTGQTGEKITIMVIPMKNTGVIDRTDTITLSTMGQTGTPARDTFTITQKAAPAIMLTDYADGENVNIAHDDTNPRTISFALGGSATGWKSDITYEPENDTSIMISQNEGTDGNITLTPSANDTTKERTATITLITTGPGQTPDSVSLMITQEAIPAIRLSTYNGNPFLASDGNTIATAHDHTNPITIDFVLGGSAKGWKSSIAYPIGTPEEDKFINSSLKKEGTDPNITIPIKDMNTTPVSRTATITLSTTGQLGISDSVLLTITQEGAPVLELTSDDISIDPNDTDSIPIEFTVGGSATGWESEIRYVPAKDTFITLSPKDSIDQTGPITIMASPMENTDIKERTATITLRTTGQKGDPASVSLTITQTALPNTPTIELISIDSISIDSISIAHDDTIPKDINFTVGGSARGWESKITYMPDIPENTNFITLNPPQTTVMQRGSITIEATSSVNENTIPRTATITLSTTGHEGGAVSVSLIITQEAKPVLELTSNDTAI